MTPPIPASKPTVVPPAPAVTYDRWAIRSQTTATADDGRISLTARFQRANATAYSPLPQDTVEVSDPDIATTAGGDSVLGPLLMQRIALDLQIAKRLLEMRGIL